MSASKTHRPKDCKIKAYTIIPDLHADFDRLNASLQLADLHCLSLSNPRQLKQVGCDEPMTSAPKPLWLFQIIRLRSCYTGTHARAIFGEMARARWLSFELEVSHAPEYIEGMATLEV